MSPTNSGEDPKTKGIADDEIQLRLQKIEVFNQTFVDRRDLFDAAVVNTFGAAANKMVAQIRRIIAAEEMPGAAHAEESRLESLAIEKLVNELRKRLARQVGSAAQPDYMFIIMPMLTADPLLDDVHDAIKRAATQFGLRAERADDIAHTNEITDKVLGSIRCAEYIVADLTHERPNVV